MNKADQGKQHAVQTTGHAWDGDLQEYNNPVPRWWVWTFYATVIFSVIYWIIFPAFPVGKSYTKGILNTITFENNKGEEVTTHWNTRSKFIHEMQSGKEALKQKAYLDQIADKPIDQIINDPDSMAFVRSMAKVLFADNCAACHGSGAEGVIGKYPNLVDDDWLWGGTTSEIALTITNGHQGYMPAFAMSFTPEQLEAVAAYVLQLSGETGGNAEMVAHGEEIFQGETGGCYYCHQNDGKGMKSQGSANLTDSIWTIANIPGAANYEAKLNAVKQVIQNGVNRQMPAMVDRLSETEIKLLTAYLHELGGGQ
jgi:cytochrome c oxidase cbb3-type subunit 3